MPPDITSVAVVVPAHQEERLVGAAVRSVLDARSPVPVRVVVVANGCTDATAARAWAAGAEVLETSVADVGRARRDGVAHALEGHDPAATWLAGTDADGVVPPDWLEAQLLAAASGVDAFVGMVRLRDEDAEANERWSLRYGSEARRAPGHGHVHGANLGVRGDAYLVAGGFRPAGSHEDRDLVGRLERSGARLLWATRPLVTTSARLDPRAPHGVGRDLRHYRLPSV